MKPETWIKMYEKVARPFIFSTMNPKHAHNMAVGALASAEDPDFLGFLEEQFLFEDEILEADHIGLHFPNPVGLAAGFDKNCFLPNTVPSIGFGFVEEGSISYRPGPGNSGEVLLRLPEDFSLVNRLGLNNCGSEVARERLAESKKRVPIGVNIAKTHIPDSPILGTDALFDIDSCFDAMYPVASYVTLNIGCPNDVHGRTYEDPASLRQLLNILAKTRGSLEEEFGYKPVLVKFSPDIDYVTLNRDVKIAQKYGIDGFIVGNTTKKRPLLSPDSVYRLSKHDNLKSAGLSGPKLHRWSVDMIRTVYDWTKEYSDAEKAENREIRGQHSDAPLLPAKEPFVIGCGGIATPEDAFEDILAGASAVQVFTGLVYKGPAFAAYLNEGIAKYLRYYGFGNVSEAVGKWRVVNFRNGHGVNQA